MRKETAGIFGALAFVLVALSAQGIWKSAKDVLNDFTVGGPTPEMREQIGALEGAANAGDLDAMFELAVFWFENGSGDDQTPNPEAYKWLSMAAESGHVMAMNEIGIIAEYGYYGHEIDSSKARLWYRKATEGGDDYAPYNLGRLYRNGFGVERNEAEASRLMAMAHEKGYATATFELGLRHAEGLGVEQSIATAKELFRQAQITGFDMQEFYRGELDYKGEGAIKLGLPEHLNSRAKNYDDWGKLSFEYASALAQRPEMSEDDLRELFGVSLPDLNAPFMYLAMKDKDWSDPILHTRMFFVAALLGHTEAQNVYADRLEKGLGTARDVEEAAHWRSRAEQQGTASGDVSMVEWLSKEARMQHTYTKFQVPDPNHPSPIANPGMRPSAPLVDFAAMPLTPADVVGRRVEEISSHVGTYGMGGPGFFGLRLGEEWLVIAVWGAEDWMIAEGRNVGDTFYDTYSRPRPWIGDDETGKHDDLSARVVGRAISAVDIRKHSLEIFFDDGFTLQIEESSERRPVLEGSKEPRTFSNEDDLRQSVFLSPTTEIWIE